MIKLLSALSVLTLALPVSATPLPVELLGERCEAGSLESCQELAAATEGQCAGPQGSGCRYSLQIVNPKSLMVNVPNFGPSRYETVAFCLYQAGVENYQDLMTDSQVGTFDYCMKDNT